MRRREAAEGFGKLYRFCGWLSEEATFAGRFLMLKEEPPEFRPERDWGRISESSNFTFLRIGGRIFTAPPESPVIS